MSDTRLSIPQWDNPALKALRDRWKWMLAMGIFLTLTGLLSISFPLATSMGVVLIVGWVLLASGILRCVHAFMAKDWSGGMAEILLGVLQIAGGALILGNVFASLATVTLVLACAILLGGLARTTVALQLKPAQGWGWMLFGGCLSILLAILLFSNLIAASAVLLGTILGIYLIFDGWAAIALALVAKRAREEWDRIEGSA